MNEFTLPQFFCKFFNVKLDNNNNNNNNNNNKYKKKGKSREGKGFNQHILTIDTSWCDF